MFIFSTLSSYVGRRIFSQVAHQLNLLTNRSSGKPAHTYGAGTTYIRSVSWDGEELGSLVDFTEPRRKDVMLPPCNGSSRRQSHTDRLNPNYRQQSRSQFL
jgi:hypothetical protein